MTTVTKRLPKRLSPARQNLAVRYRAMAAKLARNFIRSNRLHIHSFIAQELLDESMLALVRAARCYRRKEGIRFSTYLGTVVINHLTHALYKASRRGVKQIPASRIVTTRSLEGIDFGAREADHYWLDSDWDMILSNIDRCTDELTALVIEHHFRFGRSRRQIAADLDMPLHRIERVFETINDNPVLQQLLRPECDWL